MCTMWAVFLICVLPALLYGQEVPERQIHWAINPGCEKNNCTRLDCNQTLLLHVTAQGPNDTLNFLWSFYSKPTLLLAVTEPDAELEVKWDELGNSSKKPVVRFNVTPEYSFGLALDKVIEFYDPEDTANLSLANASVFMECEKFHWSMTSIKQDGTDLIVQMLGSNYDNHSKSGNISLTLTAYGKDGYGALLPHLQHSYNSSQVDIVLDNFKTSKAFAGKSRFALQLVLVDSIPGEGLDQVSERKSLDDEHTPGVFMIDELLTPKVKQGEPGGFMEWRPVAYTSPEMNIESSTSTVHYAMNNVSQADLKGSLLRDFYGHRSTHQLVPQAINISFGVSEDGFYNASHYNAWSFTMGYGLPPKEKLSMLVISILSVGLGIPILLLIGSGIFLICKKCCHSRDEPLLE